MNNKPLQHKTFIITRPKDQAQTLAKKLQALGAITIVFPTIDIVAKKNDALQAQFNQQQYDFTLFVSINAVKHSMPFCSKKDALGVVIAVGPSTKLALQSAGIEAVTCPSVYNSEGVLCLPQLQHCHDKKILIVCGTHSRQLIYESLIKKGAEVTQAICYEQHLPNLPKAQNLKHLTEQKVDAIISTSSLGLHNLYKLASPNHINWLNKQCILTISHKMTAQLQHHGHSATAISAQNATDEMVISALITHFAPK